MRQKPRQLGTTLCIYGVGRSHKHPGNIDRAREGDRGKAQDIGWITLWRCDNAIGGPKLGEQHHELWNF
jgi:hypothetical protein